MKNITNKISSGKFLISSPHLTDFFNHSVILMMEYDKEGSLGFVINKPINKKIHEIIIDFPVFDADVMLGGPVQTELLNFIHRAGNVIEGGIEICDGIYWGGSFESLKDSVQSCKIHPNDFMFFLGYSGWGAGQIDDEIKNKTWIITNSDKNIIFDIPSGDKWPNALKNIGGKYVTLSSFPADPTVN